MSLQTLILGGVRSGKSRYAESLALASGRPVTVIATALALDEEMKLRIDSHRRTRPVAFRVHEEPLALAAALRRVDAPGSCVIVDCLTLWLTQLLYNDDDARLRAEIDLFLEVLPTLEAEVVLIGNETSLGIMPLGELTRRYTDAAGRLHQDIAARVARVVLMVAGLPLHLKGSP